MKANLVFSIDIDGNEVTTIFCTKEIEDMDPALMAQLLKVFGDTKKKTKTTVERFYGTDSLQDQPENQQSTGSEEEEKTSQEQPNS